jgi:hypothetical protein
VLSDLDQHRQRCIGVRPGELFERQLLLDRCFVSSSLGASSTGTLATTLRHLIFL